MRKLGILLLFAVLLGAESEPDAFMVRALPGASSRTLAYLASLSEPLEAAVPAGLSIQEIVRRYYGNAQPSVIGVVRSFNPGFGAHTSTKATVKLPYLPTWRSRDILAPAMQSTVQQQLALHVGSAGPLTWRVVAQLNGLKDGARYGPVTQPLKVPYTSSYAVIELKPELRSKAKQIYGELMHLVRTGEIESVRHSKVFVPVPAWTTAAQGRRPPLAKLDDNPRNRWALSGLNRTTFDNRHRTATIAVIDTGIAFNGDLADSRFAYWKGEALDPSARALAARVDCGIATVGCNLIDRFSHPVDDIEPEELKFHGTHVAGLAVGRSLSSEKGILDERLQLMVLKVANKSGEIQSGRVVRAMMFADQNQANVINLSLSGPRDEVIEEKLRAFRSRLFVIAAGNQKLGAGLNLDVLDATEDTVGFPARFNSEADNVMTVAAHDEAGRLAEFSNYGRRTVHLAAPGVDVASTIGGDAWQQMSGTSQATPLVSLTSALLLTTGFPEDPAAIKRRILSTVQVTPGLRDFVESHGKLDMRRALAWRYDIVELINGDWIMGQIVRPAALDIPGRRRLAWDRVSKIVLNYSNEAASRHYVMIRVGRDYEQWVGTLDLDLFEDVHIQEFSKQGVTVIPVAKIADVTTRGH